MIQVDKLSLQAFEPLFHLPAQIAFILPQPLALLLRRSLVFTEDARKRLENRLRHALRVLLANQIGEQNVNQVLLHRGRRCLGLIHFGLPHGRDQKFEVDSERGEPKACKFLCYFGRRSVLFGSLVEHRSKGLELAALIACQVIRRIAGARRFFVRLAGVRLSLGSSIPGFGLTKGPPGLLGFFCHGLPP